MSLVVQTNLDFLLTEETRVYRYKNYELSEMINHYNDMVETVHMVCIILVLEQFILKSIIVRRFSTPLLFTVGVVGWCDGAG